MYVSRLQTYISETNQCHRTAILLLVFDIHTRISGEQGRS